MTDPARLLGVMRYVCWPTPPCDLPWIPLMKPERLSLHRLPPAPSVPAKAHSFEVHGVRIHDDYAWLKAQNWREVLKNPAALDPSDRKSTRLNSSHANISYAVFCL